MKPPKKRRQMPYEQWMESIGVPIYEGHHVEELKSVELDWWE